VCARSSTQSTRWILCTRALKFYATQRVDLRRIETLKSGTEAIGNRVRAKVVKNKLAAPFRQAEFDIEYSKGISSSGCIVDLGLEHSILTKSGAFLTFGEARLGQGRGAAKTFLEENRAVATKIEAMIRSVLATPKDVTPMQRQQAA